MHKVVLISSTVAITAAMFGQGLRLEDLERMALDRHPAIHQAAASVRMAQGKRVQAGLYPNPVLGANGDEINPGPVTRYGEWGGFIEQRIVTGGKRNLDRGIAGKKLEEVDSMARAERQRVLNQVRMLYYQALADQKLLDVRTELARIAQNSVRISLELANVGLADKPDVLAVENELQRVDLSLQMARHAQARTWRQLSAAVNQTLAAQALTGDIEALPTLDLEQEWARIEKENPDLAAGRTAIERADLSVRRERVTPVPDIQVRAGLRYNRELLDPGLKPAGMEAFFDVGVEIPIFNRNQGNIAAAKAMHESSRYELERARLTLRSRLASAYQEYQDSVAAVARYREEMLPRAEQAHEMYLRNFRQMAAPYPNVLTTQRNLFQVREDHVAALAMSWKAVVEIQGLLLGRVSGLPDIQY